MKSLALTLAIVALAFPSATFGAPSASLVSPVDNDCIGGTSQPVKGSATWTGNTGSWDWTLERGDTGQILSSRHSTIPQPAPELLRFDTTALPTGVTFTERLHVFQASDGTTADAVRSFFARFDRTPPTKPNVTTVYAPPNRQAWFEFMPSADQGCSGVIGRYDVQAVNLDDGSTWYLGASLNNGVRNGAAIDALTVQTSYALTAGTNYRLNVAARDGVGNSSDWGTGYTIKTRPDYSTVYAGQVKGSNGELLRGERVNAVANCCFAPVASQTDANGWYSLPLPGQGFTWTITYGPACTFLPPPYCSQGWGTSVAQVTTPNEVGLTIPLHRTLQPAP